MWITLLTSGSFITCFSTTSTEMLLCGQKLGITTSFRFKVNDNRLHKRCFFFSMLEDGPRGLNGSRQNREGDQNGLEEGGDVSLYGVDWEDMEDELLMTHHYQHNPILLSNPFSSAPSILSEVECTPPDCPLSAEGIHQLSYYLSQAVDVNSRSMLIRRLIWIEALVICNQIS